MEFGKARSILVESLVRNGYVRSDPVKRAMLKIPRELFVPVEQQPHAYEDRPLSILSGQTISAPHMNAMMCELLDLKPGGKILELGTGSGYHAALCAELVAPEASPAHGHVFTIERHEPLVEFARNNLERTGYSSRVTVFHADGSRGCPQHAPFDRILVTAAAPSLPDPLRDQVKEGGIICIPIGRRHHSQALYTFKKEGGKLLEKRVCGVAFVPLIGEHGHSR
ncbi:MAG: protein-L-isoaspartate(D-aspartate) O-methyltransferase [Promethearchaeota archaeon]